MGVETAFYTLSSPPHQRARTHTHALMEPQGATHLTLAAMQCCSSPSSQLPSTPQHWRQENRDGTVRHQTQRASLDVTEVANDDGLCPHFTCASAFPSHLMHTALGMRLQSGVMPKWPSTFPTPCAGASRHRPTAARPTRLGTCLAGTQVPSAPASRR